MRQQHNRRILDWAHRTPKAVEAAILSLIGIVVFAGCEMKSFVDPSVIGRWERTPVTLPILSQLDVIDDQDGSPLNVTKVRPEDLIPDVREYVIGPSDVVTVDIFELIVPGQPAIQTRQVDAIGVIRLPVVGPVKAADKSPSQLENEIADILEKKNILRDPTVSVIVQVARQNTYTITGQPDQGSTAFGTYQIPTPDFRLMQALALARGISERTKTLTVVRQVALTDAVAGKLPDAPPIEGIEDDEVTPDTPVDPTDLIERLMDEGVDAPPSPQLEIPTQARPPTAIERGLDDSAADAQWVNVGGEWVRIAAGRRAASRTTNDEDAFRALITQRLIEVPYHRLVQGDMRYNIVIRPGDMIRVPGRAAGFIYAAGAINRPGTYNVPGEDELTLMQFVASAGGPSAIGIPERTDLVRRIGTDQYTIVRINVKAIYEGTEPDFFLRPNDLVNFGTSFLATPLAIARNGLRMTYGFGFVVDRNFGFDAFPR